MGPTPAEVPNAGGIRQMQLRYLKMVTVDAKRCQLSSVAGLLNVCYAAVHRIGFVSDI